MVNDDHSSHVRRRPRPRTILAASLLTIGVLLAPVSVVAAWANVEITDTNSFVANFAPLARDPAVQAYLADQIVVAINESIDIPRLTSDAIDGITGLGTGPAATAALNALKGTAAQGVQHIIQDIVSRYVASDAFAVTWAKALRLSHNQIIATLSSDSDALISADEPDTIGLPLGPIVERLKTVLVEKGVTFADKIPTVEKTIVIARSESVGVARAAYSIVAAAGTWLPWLALVFLVAGVLAARRRIRSAARTAVIVAIVMVLLDAAIGLGRFAFLGAVKPMPAETAGSLYDQFVAGLTGAIVAVAGFACIAACIAWLVGPLRAARRFRAFVVASAARLRASPRRRTAVDRGDDDDEP
jgi:hypothetical protein